MSKSYREWSPDRAFMFPPSPQDWLPEGLESMRGEWRLICAVHNLLKLWRAGQAATAK
jgi:hypothetical protein